MMSSATFQASYGHAASPANERATLARLDTLARVMDSAFALPVIGTRVGADALLNLVPVAGVVVTKGLSAYLVWEAYRLGVPRALITRMVSNVAIDFGLSVVPVAGWIGDVFFRANMRNMALLRKHLSERSSATDDRFGEAVIIEGEIVQDDRR